MWKAQGRILFACLGLAVLGTLEITRAQKSGPRPRPPGQTRPPPPPPKPPPPAPPVQPPAVPLPPLTNPTVNVQIERNVSSDRLNTLMLGWTVQVPPKPDWEGPATRITILAPTLDANLSNGLDVLVHGWKDCEGTLFCLGGTNYFPSQVRIITGSATREPFRPQATWSFLRIPFSLSGARAETYLLKNAPKGAVWVVEHPKGDYLISGGLIEGRGTTATVIRSPNLANVVLGKMQLDVLQTQPGVIAWQP